MAEALFSGLLRSFSQLYLFRRCQWDFRAFSHFLRLLGLDKRGIVTGLFVKLVRAVLNVFPARSYAYNSASLIHRTC